MFLKTSFRIIVKAVHQWSENMDSRLAAGLAYYALFSCAPLLLLAITGVGMIYGEEQVRKQLFDQLELNMGKQSAEAVEFLIEKASKPQDTWGLVAGLTMLFIGALGMFLHVRAALSTIWKLEPPRGNTYLGILVDYLLAMAMVPVIGLLLLTMLAASTAVEFIEQQYPDTQFPWRLVERSTSIVLLALLFASLYRILSGNRIPWGYTIYGSIVASVLFSLGKVLMAYYLFYFSPASAYGAAGSVMVFLLWVYYSSHILFFGAELIQARRTRHEWLDAPAP
jgi:membrane protein